MTKDVNIRIDGPIYKWDEALPIGNGALGALVYGELNALRFSIDLAGLWDVSEAPQTLQKDFTYEKMKELVYKNDMATLNKIFDEPYHNATPTKLPTGAFVLHGLPKVKYTGEIDIFSSLASISFDNQCIHTFISSSNYSNKNIGVIELAKNEVSLEICPPSFNIDNDIKDNTNLTNSLSLLKYEKCIIIDENNFSGFIQKIASNKCYILICKKIKLESGTTILYTAIQGSNIKRIKKQAISLLQKYCTKQNFDKLKTEHFNWWKDFWEKSNIETNNIACNQIWYRANYFLASCSKKHFAPAALQGVWTSDNGTLPPWKGDYHNDLNTQFTYSHYLVANHIEQGEVFIDFLWHLRFQAKQFAKQFYGAKGQCLPGVMSINGKALGGWPVYSLSPTNYIWLCQMFFEHYRITGDKQFLKKKVYHTFLQCANLFEQLLEEKNGKYFLPLSSSPEIHDDSKEAWLKPNSNFDLSLLIYLFETLETICTLLGKKKRAIKYRNIKTKFDSLAISEKSGLRISKDEDLTESHRHFSNAMAIYPLRQITYKSEDDKKIISNTVNHIKSLGSSKWVGFSFAWYAIFSAIQKNGNESLDALQKLHEGFFSVNGFHLNGDYKNLGYSDLKYRPFTLEANFLASQAVQEMLLYCLNGEIEFFPAIPDSWKNEKIYFNNLRIENGATVSATKDCNNRITFSIKAKYACTLKIININKIITLHKNEQYIYK